MEMDQLTDEQIANLTPEQIEMLENDPSKLVEIIGNQAAKDEPKQEEQQGAANGAGKDEEEPVVLNKSGKGIIPYEKHKELRVENSALREQLQAAQAENAKATEKLEALLNQKDEARGADIAVADEALAKYLETLRDDMPELHQVISSVLDGSRKQGETLNKALEELKREKEESNRATQLSVAEQVAEAKDNNPDLSHWEASDPEAWEEALRQDEALRTNSKWASKSYAERFEETARRVRAIMPEASAPNKPADPKKTAADAKAKVESAPARKPTTLSDIQGGANPASEREQLENLSPHELAAKLIKMSPQQAAAMRAELD